MLDRLTHLQARYDEISEMLTQQDVLTDMSRVTALSKELKEVSEILKAGRDYQNLLRDQAGAKEILEQESDEELREMAKEELISLEPKLEAAENKLKQLLVPKDPNDSKSAILEIRAGTGGDEAALFAEDLFKMYQRFCDQNHLKLEVTDFSEGGAGGYKEIIASITGPDAYGTLKFESGVHRVQRVPDTETQGRIHTSAATVMVLPEAEDVDIELREQDIRKDTFCASGNGGQSVNTTYSAVRLTHMPSGIVVSMQNEKSQIKNLDLAMRILKARLYDMEMQKRHAEETALRRSLVSSGDRSAKIRTYNYPQSRVTDHRIGLTVYNLPGVLGGQLTEFIDALRLEETAQRMGEGTMA